MGSDFMNEFNIVDCKPKETLEECLNDCSIDTLKEIALSYNVDFKEKIEFVNYFKEEILNRFKSKLNDLPYYMYQELSNSSNKFLFNMIKLGFMFHYHKVDNNCINIIPKEIKDIFNEYIKEHKDEYLYNVLKMTIKNYLLINSFIPKDTLEKIILSYKELHVTKELFNKAIKELDILTIKNYYTGLSLENVKNVDEGKCNLSYYRVDLFDLSLYIDKLLNIMNTIKLITGSKTENLEKILIELLKKHDNEDEFIKYIKKEYHINKDKKNQLEQLIYNSTNDFRYWNLKGMTYEEYCNQIFLEKGILNELPNNTDLLSCLNSINDEGYNLIKNYISFNGNSKIELKKDILDRMNHLIKHYSKEYLTKLLEYNHNYYDKFIKSDLLFHGFIFLYLDDDIKVLIPDEIVDYIKSLDQSDIVYLTNLYVKNNGVIDIDILVKLLNEYHNINITKEDLLECNKKYNVPTIDNKYYSFFQSIPNDYKKQLLLLKDKYGKYKKLDLESDYVQDLLNEFDNIMDNLNEDNQNILVSYFLSPLFNGTYDKSALKESLRQNKLIRYYDALDKIASKYKNKIGIWPLNGYTLKDGISVSKKIGRNDPCPCGSGKKYKKCCGK